MNTCKTCKRPDILEINADLGAGVSARCIMAKFAKLSMGGLQRHKENCLEELFAEVREQRRAGLLADVDEVKKEITVVKQQFTDNPNVRVGLIGKMLDAIEKEAKLTGAYQQDKKNIEELTLIADRVAESLMAKGWVEADARAFVAGQYKEISQAAM